MREAITKIVPLLSKKAVTVTMRGMRAFVEYDPNTGRPIRVNLPYLPDDASEELMNAVQGFLDHEVGHILFTDPRSLAEAAKHGEEVASMHNIVEDTFVERRMHEQFQGSAYNLANVSRFFLKNMVQPKLTLAKTEGDEKAVLSQLIVPTVRAWAGQRDFEAFMDDKWDDVQKFRQLVGDDLIERIPECRNSMECLELAREITKRISEGGVKPPPPPPPQEGGEGKGDGSSGQGKDDGKGDGKQQEPGGKGEEQAKGKAEKGDGKEEGEEKPGEHGNAHVEEQHSHAEETMAALRDTADFDASVAEALTARAEKESHNSEYLVFTRDDDKVEPMTFSKAAVDEIPKMQGRVDAMLGVITKDIQRMVEARSAAVWTGGHKSGRLHGAALMRAQFNRVDLFRRKQENKTKDVAGSLIMDISGSMRQYQKLTTAVDSCYALSSVLDRLGIDHEVSGFTTRSLSQKVMDDLLKDPRCHDYARHEGLMIPIFKAFNERMGTDVMARLLEATIAGGLCRANVDGESILLAAMRLEQRRAARKIMIVLSDGRPAVNGGSGDLDKHLKAVIKSIQARNIDIVGLGIMDESVSKFYPKHVVMKSVNDLPGVVAGQLKKFLVQ
jgi:cobalamin biosynthesis protein CobT